MARRVPLSAFMALPHRAKRLFIVGALSLAALWLVYVVAGNILLRSGAIPRWISKDESALRVRFDGASTWWPGHVDVSAFELRMQDHNIQLWVRVPRASVRVGLLGLLRREMSLDRVRAEGISFRLRWRVAPDWLEAPHVRAYPPIEGFPNLGKVPPGPPSGSPTWVVRLDDVDVSLDEIWIQQFRRHAKARARGRMEIQPTVRARVDRTVVDLPRAPITYGEDGELARAAEGRIEFSIAEHDVKKARAEDRFSMAGWLNADIEDLRAFSPYMPKDGKLSGGRGFLHVRPHLRAGGVGEDARIDLDVDDVHAALGRVGVEGDMSLRFRAEEAKERAPAGLLRAQFPKVHLFAEPLGKQALHLRDARATIRTEPIRLSTGTGLRGLDANAPDVRLADLGALDVGGDSWTIERGSARGKARVEVDAGRALTATAHVDLRDVLVRTKKLRLSLQGSIDGTAQQESFEDPRGRIEDAELSLTDVLVTGAGKHSARGSLGVVARRFRYDDFEPESIDASVRGRFNDADALLQAFGIASSGLPGVVRGALPLKDLSIEGRLSRSHGTTLLRLDQARSGDVKARGLLATGRNGKRGAFRADLPLINVGVVVRDDDVAVKPFAGDDWLREQLRKLGLPKS